MTQKKNNLAKLDIILNSALNKALIKAMSGEIPKVSISYENSKMGPVASVSLMPILTCPGNCSDGCALYCYAARMCTYRPNVLEAYARNTAILMTKPAVYWAAVDLACKTTRAFRFHVSGDIPTLDYFDHMVKVAKDNPETQILFMTKKWQIVNEWIAEHETGDHQGRACLPANMHPLFSRWFEAMVPENPYGIPETAVYEDDDDLQQGWIPCNGNCFNCFLAKSGCWAAQERDTIALKLHEAETTFEYILD